MEPTDYDMKVFEDQIKALREEALELSWPEPSDEAKSYFISDDSGGKASCMEYKLSTVQDLHDKFDCFLSVKTADESKRAALIRSCVASCFKYEGLDQLLVDEGEISEFIYEL